MRRTLSCLSKLSSPISFQHQHRIKPNLIVPQLFHGQSLMFIIFIVQGALQVDSPSHRDANSPEAN